MASPSGRNTASVEETLYGRPSRFEFFQAVRLVKMLRRKSVGIAAADPDEETLRFRSDVSLAFPRSEITRLLPPGDEERAAVMTIGFLGMATPGSFGSLPTPYVEEILAQEPDHGLTLSVLAFARTVLVLEHDDAGSLAAAKALLAAAQKHASHRPFMEISGQTRSGSPHREPQR